MKIRSFKHRLALAIIGSSAAFMVLLGMMAMSRISRLTRDSVQGEALGLVEHRASDIAAFFQERGRIVTTIFKSPPLLQWFAAYNEFRKPIDDDPGYRQIKEYFTRIQTTDPTVLSVFFATNSTSEYFKADGRVERDGYFVKERWWWKEAVQKDRLYVSPPGVDANTGDIAVTIQGTIYLPDETFLGVGGIDFDLATVGQLVGGVKYRDQGQAFLADDKGQLIYFPGLDLDAENRIGEPLETEMADIDEIFEDSDGFAQLADALHDRGEGLREARLNGEEVIVLFAPVRSDSPELEWTLGLMVPAEMISGPIYRAQVLTWLVTFIAIAAIAAVSLLVTDRIVSRPVSRLAARFEDIAAGEGDLTQRVDASGKDEIAALATSFNDFVSSIQHDVAAMAELAADLSRAADDLSHLSHRIAKSAEDTSSQAEAVSQSAGRVSDNVGNVASATNQMDASIREIAANAAQAADVAKSAVDLSEATSHRFQDLNDGASGISSFAEVIEGIAAQTNLLALNATIEAARAGEMGKGFAVVANEVKALASQSSEATQEIHGRLDLIETSTARAGEAIAEVREIIAKINEIQGLIATAVEEQTATTSEISRNVSEAAVASDEIAQAIAVFAEAMRESAAGVVDTRKAAEQLAEMSSDLHTIVSRFKY